jgi:hypothetical protein
MATSDLKQAKHKTKLITSTGTFMIVLQVNADGSYDRNSKTDRKVESLERTSAGTYRLVLKPHIQVLTTQVMIIAKPYYQKMLAEARSGKCECGRGFLVYVQVTDSKGRPKDSSFGLSVLAIEG